jgi:hypothetical protein
MPDREREQRRRCLASGEDDVALVLPVGVVDNHDSPAGGDVGDRPVHGVKSDPVHVARDLAAAVGALDA